jgi:nucleoside-diphosphate-sugar epimerase
MKRATVLGNTGYIGRPLTQYLQSLDWEVLTPARGDEASLWAQDLGTVFYCVGLTADFRSYPLETVEAHVELLRRVLAQARFKKLVYLSSTRIYRGAANTAEEQTLVCNPHDADDLYKLSKLMGESLALQSGRPCLVARLSNIVGGDMRYANSFVQQLWSEARAGHIVLRSHPDSVKDYAAIDDVVSLLVRIAESSRHRVYNLASGVQLSHRQWWLHIAQATQCSWSVADNAPLQSFAPICVGRLRSEFFLPHAGIPS